ncbi:MAG: hypothetical protein D6714_07095 [Bacteroidetes bacterium]|nr:MAG: hypothetical protein D6714_07095 [Bacteroidota bacterium]
MSLPLYVTCQLITVLLTLGVLSAVLYGLRYAFLRLRLPKDKREALIRLIRIGLFMWLSILAALAWSGMFKDAGMLILGIGLVFFPPLILGVVLLRSRFFRLVLKALPPEWLIWIQTFRLFLAGMFWLGWSGGFVPLQLTFWGLNQDIIVGLSAVAAGGLFFRRRQLKFQIIVWNGFGVLLFIHAILLAFLSLPSPLQVFTNEPSAAFLTDVPFIWVPGFLFPFGLVMHFFSLKQLAGNGSKGGER